MCPISYKIIYDNTVHKKCNKGAKTGEKNPSDSVPFSRTAHPLLKIYDESNFSVFLCKALHVNKVT